VELIEDFVVWINGLRLVVPAGFVSDLASVPWLFQRVLPRFGPWNAAAIVHDYLYRTGRLGDWVLRREDADRIMLALMRYNPEVPRWKAWVIFMGVRLGAFGPWMMYRNGGGYGV